MGKVPLTTTLEAALPQAPELPRHWALTPGVVEPSSMPIMGVSGALPSSCHIHQRARDIRRLR